MKPLGKIKIEWPPEFAYAIGLLATDGCLYGDEKGINFTSKDEEQIFNFMKCLRLKDKIGKKWNGLRTGQSFVVQFGDVSFYKFLNSIGITSQKSKIIGTIKIPDEYFFDFLCGHFDGDGSFHSYFDPRWKLSYMFYTEFISASKSHIEWVRRVIYEKIKIKGHISSCYKSAVYQLRYAKGESLKLLPKLYYNPQVVCFSRKRKKSKALLRE